MADYDSYIDGTYGDPQITSRMGDSMLLLSKEVDFSLRNLDAGVGDVLRVLEIRPETLVLAAWLRVKTGAPSDSTLDLGYGSDVNYWGNGLVVDTVGEVPTILTGTLSRSAGDIATDESETNSMTINGATFGDTCIINMQADAIDLMFYAYVKSANTVETVAQNSSGGNRDPDGVYEVFVDKAPMSHVPLLFTASDTLDIVATDDLADVNVVSGIVEVKAIILDLRLT